MNTLLRVVVRGTVRVAGEAWFSPVLDLHQGAMIEVRMEAGRAEAVLDGTAHPLTRLER